MKPKKPKKCKSCGAEFVPSRSLQAACSVRCAIELSRKKTEKEQEKAAKKRLRDLDRRYWIKRAQSSFNAYIRARDHGLPCICCQRLHGGHYHAGHYRSVGSCPQLRFEPLNCHKSCAPCNLYLSGNLIQYRKNLIEKIGHDSVSWLEGSHKPKKYSIEDLKKIDAAFKEKTKELQRQN